jgi:cytochrome c2
VLAQRKLADAEAALKKAKEEGQRASAEVERAKAEAQNARESEAAIKHKLADAEAARVKAEQACHSGDTTRPGLGGRLRQWLGRTPNP